MRHPTLHLLACALLLAASAQAQDASRPSTSAAAPSTPPAHAAASHLPNLVVSDIDISSTVTAGTEESFDFTVAEVNDPDGFYQLVNNVPFDMTYYLVVDGVRVEVGDRTNPTSFLWPVSRMREFSGRADIPAGLAPGDYTFIVAVDTDDEVAESDEGDNERSTVLTVEAGPNLIVSDIDISSTVTAGTEESFDFTVAEVNDPDGFYQLVNNVPFDMTYYLVVDGVRVEVGDRTNPTSFLWPVSRMREFSGRADIPAGLAPGDYTFIVAVDTDDEVAESDEGDNERSTVITVEAVELPDLVITSASVTPTSAAPGADVEVTFTVENQGTGSISGNVDGSLWFVNFYLSEDGVYDENDETLGSASYSALLAAPPGWTDTETETEDVPTDIAPGSYFLLVVADAADRVMESDDGNNTFAPIPFEVVGNTAPVTITLVPTDPPSPVVISRGERLSFNATFDVAAAGPSSFEYWTEATLPNGSLRGPLLGPNTIQLTPGSAVTLSFQQRVPPGAPLGDYTYAMLAGTYPNGILAEDSFTATVTASPSRPVTAGDADAGADVWAVYDGAGRPLPAGTVHDLREFGVTADMLGAESGESASSSSRAVNTPAAFALRGVYPNPLSGVAAVGYDLPEAARVRVAVYDVLGREVVMLDEGEVAAGRHLVRLDASAWPSGVYVVRLAAGSDATTRRVTVVR